MESEDDGGNRKMMNLKPQCFDCKHFNIETSHCTAYPKVDIPEDIISGEHDHRTPYEGDHGITFEKA